MRPHSLRPLVAACAAVIASANASAMYVNAKGEGQVLLYPYYSVDHGQQTLLTVSNTDSNGKALRIAFREGLNGREVLSFNLYLSAHDTWTGVVFALSDAGLGAPNSGAAIGTTDTSCTEPALPQHTDAGLSYQPFLNYAFTGNAEDGGPTDNARTREGFFQIIEMADVSSALVDASIAHCSGLPLVLDPAKLSAPTGGLVGAASIINVAEGTYYSFDATAIQGFFDEVKYSLAGHDDVNLTRASATPSGGAAPPGSIAATALADGQLRELNYAPEHAIDAVSALLMNERLDLQIENAAGIFSDWVITFPTKQYYVDPLQTQNAGAVPPFSERFAPVSIGTNFQPARSNVRVSMDLWNRDGGSILTNDVLSLAYETNVLSRSPGSGSALWAANTAIPLVSNIPPISPGPPVPVPEIAGQATLWLSPAEEPHALRPALDGTSLQGLPAIGFEAIKYVNANVSAGVLANYSGTAPLKGH